MITEMDEYVGIVKIEKNLGHTLLLQDYTSYFYLRVENSDGWGVLKIRLSRQGEILKDYVKDVQDDQEFAWVRWAQNLIQQK